MDKWAVNGFKGKKFREKILKNAEAVVHSFSTDY